MRVLNRPAEAGRDESLFDNLSRFAGVSAGGARRACAEQRRRVKSGGGVSRSATHPVGRAIIPVSIAMIGVVDNSFGIKKMQIQSAQPHDSKEQRRGEALSASAEEGQVWLPAAVVGLPTALRPLQKTDARDSTIEAAFTGETICQRALPNRTLRATEIECKGAFPLCQEK